MGKAGRHQQLAPILGAQLIAHPTPEGWATATNINSDIKDRPPTAAHQLGLRIRWALKMQAAHRAHLCRKRMVVLHKLKVDPVFCKRRPAVGFGEKSAMVAKAARGQKENAREKCV